VRAAQLYSATYGHPVGSPGFSHADNAGARRWSVAPRTAIIAALVILVLAGGTAFVALRPHELRYVADLSALPEVASITSTETDTATPGVAPDLVLPGPDPADQVVVYVVGQVATPGVVTLPAGARVSDAVAAAGGVTADADLAAVNLARFVTDGEQITIPLPGQEVTPAPVAPAQAAAGGEDPGGMVNINTADAAALDQLPGIGPVLAQRIIEWRNGHGRFASVDELMDIPGIGSTLIAKIRDRARV
jgi:competence protein ComEA